MLREEAVVSKAEKGKKGGGLEGHQGVEEEELEE